MNKERGEGRLGLVIALIVVAVAVYVGIKVIPLKVALFSFADKIEQKIQRESWRTYELAQKDTIEFVKQQAAYTGYDTRNLKVTMKPPVTGEMIVVVDWQIPLDFAVTQYTWNYHLEKKAPMLGRGGSAF